jgi:hypothetical protein
MTLVLESTCGRGIHVRLSNYSMHYSASRVCPTSKSNKPVITSYAEDIESALLMVQLGIPSFTFG